MKKFIVPLVALALFFTSCTTNSEETQEAEASAQSDFTGTFSGTLPCADCEGIETTFKFFPNFTFEKISNYLGNEEPLNDKVNGTFSITDGIIHLEGIEDSSNQLKIEERAIRYLDMDGNEVEGELAEFYVLTKNGNPKVEDKRWHLVELQGKEIGGSSEDYYIIFHSKEGNVEAKANCNNINLPYIIKNNLMLSFGQGLSTLMACPDEDTEQQLMEVLSVADNLSIDEEGQTLTLNKARMAPLAVYKLAK